MGAGKHHPFNKFAHCRLEGSSILVKTTLLEKSLSKECCGGPQQTKSLRRRIKANALASLPRKLDPTDDALMMQFIRWITDAILKGRICDFVFHYNLSPSVLIQLQALACESNLDLEELPSTSSTRKLPSNLTDHRKHPLWRLAIPAGSILWQLYVFKHDLSQQRATLDIQVPIHTEVKEIQQIASKMDLGFVKDQTLSGVVRITKYKEKRLADELVGTEDGEEGHDAETTAEVTPAHLNRGSEDTEEVSVEPDDDGLIGRNSLGLEVAAKKSVGSVVRWPTLFRAVPVEIVCDGKSRRSVIKTQEVEVVVESSSALQTSSFRSHLAGLWMTLCAPSL